jgi:hypothetical protein
MDYIRGANRHQVILFPESVEDYITEDNPVRFIDAFVSSLDLAELGFLRAQPAETGRPAYDQAGHGSRLLSDAGIEQGGSRDELDYLELQHQKSNQHLGSEKDD